MGNKYHLLSYPTFLIFIIFLFNFWGRYAGGLYRFIVEINCNVYSSEYGSHLIIYYQ